LAKQHTSFLLRCWRLATGAVRVEVEHIPTGGRTVVPSWSLAAEWMQARWEEVVGAPSSDVTGEQSDQTVI
jgi:hypothetical protein